MPMEIRTIGPETDRRWRGGGNWPGGACIGLAIPHLSDWRLSFSGSERGTTADRSSRRWQARRRLAFQQFGNSDCQQQDGPGPMPSRPANVLDQRQKTNRDQNNRTDESAHAVGVRIRTVRGNNAPPSSEEPQPQQNQNAWPEYLYAELKYPHRLQKENDSETDQHNRSDRNLGRVHLLPCTKGLPQTQRIGNGLPRLNCFRSPHRVDDLPNVEKRKRKGANGIEWAALIHPHDQPNENQQVSQAFRILPAIYGPDAEWKKAGKNASHCRVRTRTWNHHWLRNKTRGWRRWWRDRLRGAQTIRQAVLAVNDPLYVPSASSAKRFPAGAAVSDCWVRGVVGAIHSSLLCAARFTTGGLSGSEARITWLSP